MTAHDLAPTWNLSSAPDGRIVHDWHRGRFEAASRPFTAAVAGTIRPERHLVMATLKGGARRHAFETDGGLRYAGRDAVGMVSFLPAGCERRLMLEDVAWEWGAIALGKDVATELDSVAPFIAPTEPFVFGLIAQMHGLMIHDGALDATYCDVMGIALAEYLSRRANRRAAHRSPAGLSPRQLRVTLQRIEHLLDRPIRIADLAGPLELSDGHFHRAFRAATGSTPLQVITQRRVERAAGLLSNSVRPISEIALDVGFANASHMARLFRSILGCSPLAYRRQFRSERK
jgi:AraC family transcriptional regulator